MNQWHLGSDPMTRMPSTIAALTLTFCFACSAVGPGLTGNDTGGIINWTPEHQRVARPWAAAHCASFGKAARITSIYARYGQYIAFECYFPRTRHAWR
jgi:hypothetical protein